jgi:putative transposase
MLCILDNDTEDEDGFKAEPDAIILEGVRRMLLAAIQAEVADYMERHKHHVDEDGRRLVVRNGKAQPRTVTTAAMTDGGRGAEGQ